MGNSKKSAKSWERIISAYDKSNLGKSDFCNENNLKPSIFYYWCNKLRPDLKSPEYTARSSSNPFLPVKTSSKNESFNITLENGLAIKFSSLPEPSWIAKLITSVENLNDQH